MAKVWAALRNSMGIQRSATRVDGKRQGQAQKDKSNMVSFKHRRFKSSLQTEQSHPQFHGELETSLSYIKPYKQTNKKWNFRAGKS